MLIHETLHATSNSLSSGVALGYCTEEQLASAAPHKFRPPVVPEDSKGVNEPVPEGAARETKQTMEI